MSTTDFESLIPPAGEYPRRGPGCKAVLDLPGVCSKCAVLAAEAAASSRARAWARNLPEAFRDASWAALPELRNDAGNPRVDLRNPTPARWEGLRRALENPRRVVLIGPPGCGKTTVAVAHARAQVEARPDARVRFIAAENLTDAGTPPVMALALGADVLVLDDVGAELHGAEVGSGLLAQRVEPVTRVICERFDRRLPLVVTTGLNKAQIEALYAPRVARRLFEGAAVIRLGSAPTAEPSRSAAT